MLITISTGSIASQPPAAQAPASHCLHGRHYAPEPFELKGDARSASPPEAAALRTVLDFEWLWRNAPPCNLWDNTRIIRRLELRQYASLSSIAAGP
jgi:hypothetical protein